MAIRWWIAGALLLSVVLPSAGTGAAAPRAARLPAFAVASDPDWSPGGGRIAFVASSTPGGPRALYALNADGTGIRRLTESGFDAAWPSWSPDGRRIAFQHSTETRSGSDLYIVNADGGGLRPVVADGAEPAWGPGGGKIAFSRRTPGGNSRILAVSPDGSGLRLVADSHDECETYVAPSWSPDGERVAFSATGAGYECGFANFIGSSRGYGARVKVLVRGSFGEPDWSPGGVRIAVLDFSGSDSRAFMVATFELRTARMKDLRSGSHPRWSPKGDRIVFVRGTVGPRARSQLYVMNADGSHLRQLTR
jgi:TolB protein